MITTFYSYKGGAGRTMALANYACHLAQLPAQKNGRILMIDWDLEAPGLHRYFPKYGEATSGERCRGVIDYFCDLNRKLAENPANYPRLAEANGFVELHGILSLDDYVVPEVFDGVSRVDMMPAGLFDSKFVQRVGEFQWAEFFKKYPHVFRAFQELIASRYTHCLIDSRTGLTDTSGICTMLMPEKLVAVFNPNVQSLDGILDLLKRSLTYRACSNDFRPLAIFPLPSRIENVQRLQEWWRERYQHSFETFFVDEGADGNLDLTEYFNRVLLPHKSDYAFGEKIAIVEEKFSEIGSLRKAYEEFFEILTKCSVPWELAVPETSTASGSALLRILHVPRSDPAAFQVVRLSDGKITPADEVPSPVTFPVEGRKDALMGELQWYLERFLDYPFSPETEHAERILAALKDWGKQTFRALFTNPAAVRFFDASIGTAYFNLHLQIASDDSRILAWPWEALWDPELGWLAQTCQIERRLNSVRDPQPIPKSLPKDRVNILLVVARPYGEKDVRFRSMARPVVEMIEKEGLPASVELLRPPTFDGLREHLRQRPDYYHILHFDCHGAFTSGVSNTGDSRGGRAGGTLLLESEDGGPEVVTADKLSAALREHAIPAVILNAAQSAMVDQSSNDPFASIATTLLRSGIRDVVAMSYSLYISAAQQFLPAFYRGFFDEGSMAKAVRLGRQQMWTHEGRVCARGTFPLQDWLLPVLYRQEPLDFSFAASDGQAERARKSKLPEDLHLDKEPYGLIGRDSAILALERAMRRNTPAVLIQGLGGVGKTTLAKGFLQWLDATGGLENPPFWFSFQDIRSAEYVFNRMSEGLGMPEWNGLALDKKPAEFNKLLRQYRFLIVWDNFESAAGIAGTVVSANMPQEDRSLLAGFLDGLRGGKTKVLITSRSTEDWLGPQRRFLLVLGGMDHEERWEYCDAVLRNLGLRINREDSKLIELMNQLGGHPLAMRAILPLLEKMTASQVVATLRRNLADLGAQSDEALARVYATLGFVQQSLPSELQALLVPLGLHENYVDADCLEHMAKEAYPTCTRAGIDSLMQALAAAGLLRDIGQAIYEMHPLLTSYLRSAVVQEKNGATREKWTGAFVDVMGSLADALAPRELHEQRGPFHLQGQNFYYALDEAERLGMSSDVAALTQAIGSFALNTRNLVDAERLFRRCADHQVRAGDPNGEASAYHQLGRVAEEQREFATAEKWYLKSLAIAEQQGNERGAANTYHQLGMIADKRRDSATAEEWYRKSLAIEEKQGNERGAANTYHQLGMIADKRRDFATAEEWYLKSLAINEKQGNEQAAAVTCHQLGLIAAERGEHDVAQRWYLKSLALNERIGNEHGSARTYHQIGMLAQERADFSAAEEWYLKSLAVKERLADELGASITYHQLGRIAEERRDFATAEKWYLKSLAIKEMMGDFHGAAITKGQLGVLAGLEGRFEEGGRWLTRSIAELIQASDQHEVARSAANFFLFYKHSSPSEREKLDSLWTEARLGDPKEFTALLNTSPLRQELRKDQQPLTKMDKV
jgi:tetratricopeptide (TPR) repeat protein